MQYRTLSQIIGTAMLMLVMLNSNLQAKTIQSPANKVNLLEVYTSQGCSSCPPAERWLTELETDERLWKQYIPMNLHVDYWDYLGWKDPFSDPQFSARQRMFQKRGYSRTVATPGFILNGRGWNGWFYKQSLPLIDEVAAGSITAEVNDQQVAVEFESTAPLTKNVIVHVAILGFDISTDVTRGENKGKVLDHDFVVLSHYATSMLVEGSHGRASIAMPSVSQVGIKKRGVAIWVSFEDDPTPIQAAGDWL